MMCEKINGAARIWSSWQPFEGSSEPSDHNTTKRTHGILSIEMVITVEWKITIAHRVIQAPAMFENFLYRRNFLYRKNASNWKNASYLDKMFWNAHEYFLTCEVFSLTKRSHRRSDLIDDDVFLIAELKLTAAARAQGQLEMFHHTLNASKHQCWTVRREFSMKSSSKLLCKFVCVVWRKKHWFHGGKYSPLLITIQCNWHLLVLSI